MNKTFEKTIFLQHTNNVIQDLLEVCKDDKVTLTKQDEWAICFDLEIHPNIEKLRKSLKGYDHDYLTTGAFFVSKTYTEKEINQYMKESKFYINIGVFSFHKDSNIHDAYVESSHAAHSVIRLLESAGFKASDYFKEKLFNQFMYSFVRYIEEFFKENSLKLKNQ